jgi:hypothetical protein
MRTSEIVSQIHMTKVAKAYDQRAGKLRFLVLSVEQSEAPFVKAYVEFEQLPFPIGVAEGDVVLGKSVLGVISFVPYTYFIDASGRVESAAPGVIQVEEMVGQIDHLLDF